MTTEERVRKILANSTFPLLPKKEQREVRKHKIETHIEVLNWLLDNDEMPDSWRKKLKKRLEFWLDTYERNYTNG